MHEVPFSVTLTALRGAELARKLTCFAADSELFKRLRQGELSDDDLPHIRKVVDEGPGCEGFQPEKPPVQLVRYMCHGGTQARKWLDDLAEGPQDPFSIEVKIDKVDAELGIVFGYAIVCTEKNDQYFDLHDDHIPESSMLEATAKYMAGSRIAKDMHAGEPCGQVVYGFPMTREIAKSLNITIERSGFIVGMKPDSADMLVKFRDGEYTGFSIGGRRVRDSEVY